ncbi:WD repeat-containing protein on Y chromosome isoform X3 [Esox lucius]|uniref:WD repeat-containing protein on Y chromosome isoform X3 n=1 Tax=Esox lucius TaxID=8010 RepID=UPI001476B9C3|nr:WD repeat-containing protein on Y chromosome isoform X3 [Esox lucius]
MTFPLFTCSINLLTESLRLALLEYQSVCKATWLPALRAQQKQHMNLMKNISSEARSSTDENNQKPNGHQAPAVKAAVGTKSGSPEEAYNRNQGRVEDQINEEHLKRIEAMFHEADLDGEGGLDMEEFREAIKKIMGDIDDEDVDIIFMKVDTNCDGHVDWDEYLNYMLLEYREKDSFQKLNRALYFPTPLQTGSIDHREPIVRLQFFPFQVPQGRAVPKTRNQLGHYLSVSQDGILNYWSERFTVTRTVNLDQLKRTPPFSSHQQMWVTDMICLSNLNQLALASTRRHLEFYDISAKKCDILFSLTGLEGYVEVMDYWSDETKGVFSIADDKGFVSVFISNDVLQFGLFSIAAFKSVSGGNCQIPIPVLLKNTSKNFLCFKVAVHNNCCHQIRFLHELNAVATCSSSDHTSMVITTVPPSQKAKIQNSAFQVRRGILCFDYSPELNILVSGGLDGVVRIWNPYLTRCATSHMKGHSAAITHIMVNGEDNKVISVSKDKNVRVWDLEDCACLQSVPSGNVTMGHLPISSVHYNRHSNTLLLATSMIGVLHGAVDHVEGLHQLKTTHEQQLCAALYNCNFKQVVSGCHAGVVSVWEILTGERVMQFQTSPAEKAVEVTAMAFDGPKRRLITGSKDGALRLWNFNNGALLATLPAQDDSEVTGIHYINQRIYVSGWSKRVMWYLDVKEDMELEYRVWNQYHTEDIYSMHADGKKMLVTASYSGDIVVWNIDSGQAFCRFNAYESPRPLLPIRVIDRAAVDRFKASVSQGLFDESNQTQHRLSAGPSAPPSPQGDKDSSCGSAIKMIQVIFLCSRERNPDTAILLSSAADGFVYAWSTHHQGGLLGKFCAVHLEDTAVISMATDQQDQVLFTGDSAGYITLWDIERYSVCMPRDEEGMTPQQKAVHLRSLIPAYCKVTGPRRVNTEARTEALGGWSVCLTPPPLLNSWRGHLKGVVSVEYVERFQLVITASLDRDVRLWNVTGQYIGTFGQDRWCVGDPHASPTVLPADLRRVASYQTLKVLNRGKQPHWNCAKRILETLRQLKLLHATTADTCRNAASNPQELDQLDPHLVQYSNDQFEDTWLHWKETSQKEPPQKTQGGADMQGNQRCFSTAKGAHSLCTALAASPREPTGSDCSDGQ